MSDLPSLKTWAILNRFRGSSYLSVSLVSPPLSSFIPLSFLLSAFLLPSADGIVVTVVIPAAPFRLSGIPRIAIEISNLETPITPQTS